MYPVSQDFLNTVRRGGPTKTVVDLYFNQLIVKSNIPVSDWTINSTSSSVIRSSGHCTVVDPLLVPTFFSDDSLVIPAGAELILKTGFVYPGGVEELIPMGVFTIESANWKDGRSSEVELEFFDRGKAVERYGWNAPQDFSGQMAATVLTNLVNVTASYYTLSIPSPSTLSNYKLPGGSVLDTDRLANLSGIAKNMGGQIYFNRNGLPILVAIPQVTSATTVGSAVWKVDAGTNGVLVEASKGLSRTGVYSAVAVYGATPSEGAAQVYATSIDNNPNSTTYYYGPFGRVWISQEDNSLTTRNQCQVLANTLMSQSTGLAKSINFQLVPNAALDVDDLIVVQYYDGSQELHIIDSYDISPTSMFANTRSLQFIS